MQSGLNGDSYLPLVHVRSMASVFTVLTCISHRFAELNSTLG